MFSQEERVLIRTGGISFLGPRGLNPETNTLQLRRSPAREQWCFSFTLFSHIQPSSLCCKLSWAPAGRSRDAGLSLTLAVPCWQGRVRSLGTAEERRTLGHTEPSQVKLSNTAAVQRKEMTSSIAVEIRLRSALSYSVLCKQQHSGL